MKLRTKLLSAWLGFELLAACLALPAFAGLSHHISFSVPAQVHAQQLEAPQGTSRFLVASNTPFAVISHGAATELNVRISQSGIEAGLPFGRSAQMPGNAENCNMPANGQDKWRIYTSFDRTAARRGSKIEQSVLLEITYDPEMKPEFEIVPMDDLNKSAAAYLALPCRLMAS